METPADRASKCDIKQVVAVSLAQSLSLSMLPLSLVEGLSFHVNQVFVRNGRIVLLGEVRISDGTLSGRSVENGVREFVLEPVAWQQPKAVSEAPPWKAAENIRLK